MRTEKIVAPVSAPIMAARYTGFLLALAATMSQKSSVPQLDSSVSQVLKRHSWYRTPCAPARLTTS